MSEQINRETRLSAGTQEILLRNASAIPCCCGMPLTWKWFNNRADITATAECECGMSYTAMLATVKIEGVDRNTL